MCNRLIPHRHGALETTLGGGYGLGWWHYDGSEIGDPGAFGARAWINSDAGYAAYWVIEDSFLTSREYESSCVVLSMKP